MSELVLALLAGWLLVCWVQVAQVKRLQAAVTLLPHSTSSATPYVQKFPLLGENIRQMLPWPERFAGRKTVLLITSSVCSACHVELEEFLEANEKRGVPFGCLLIEGERQTDEFLEAYRGAFPTMLVSSDELEKFELRLTPHYLVVDEAGEVISSSRLLNWKLLK